MSGAAGCQAQLGLGQGLAQVCPCCRTAQAGGAAPRGAGTGWHQPGPDMDQAVQGTFHWEQPRVCWRQWRTFPGECALPVQADPGACQASELPCTAELYLPQKFPSLSDRTCKNKSHPLRASCSFFYLLAASLRMTTSLKQHLLNH